MTSEDFKRAWEQDGDRLVTFPAEAVATLNIPGSNRAFLIQTGLPSAAAPFLDFGDERCLSIPSAAEMCNAGETYQRYRVIGGNGLGDPICLDENSAGAVVYLDHDDGMECGFINSNVECLAFSLLAFRDVVRETQRRGGTDAYLHGQIPNELVDQFILRMEEIDPPAIKIDTFWFRSIMGDGI